MKHFLRLTAAAAMSLAVTVAFSPAAAQDDATPLTVYSGRSEGLIGPILEQFTAETGIPVEVRYGDSAQMAATILEEGANSPADVYISQDAGALGALAQASRLVVLPSDVLEDVPAEFRSATDQWVGLSGRARVLVYNTNVYTPETLPASLLDLTDAAYSGRVGWAPTNGSFQAQVTGMRVLLGEEAAAEWLTGMVANGTVTFEGNGAVVQAVIDGEIDLGIVNHYYLYQFLADNPDIPVANHFFPAGDVGALINVAGGGVVDTSDQKGLGQRLLLYLLGNNAQTYFSEETAEYPVVEGIGIREGLTPLAEIEAPEIDLSNLSDLQGTLELLSTTGALP